jgi:hypothetical protein
MPSACSPVSRAGADAGYVRVNYPPYNLDAFTEWQRTDSVSSTVAAVSVVLITPTDMEQVNLCLRTWSPGGVWQKVLFSAISARHIPFGQIRPGSVWTDQTRRSYSLCTL